MLTKMIVPIHIWRSTGDFTSAKEFYDKYSVVDESFYKVREFIVENNSINRRSLQYNLVADKDNNITVKKYNQSLEGIIESFVDR